MSAKRLSAEVRKILLLCCLVPCAAALSAQTTDKLTLDKKTGTLSGLFEEIQSKSGYVVVTNVAKTNIGRHVAYYKTEGSVTEILDSSLSGTGLSYSVNGRYIVIVPDGNKAIGQTSTQQSPEYTQPQAAQAGFERDVRTYTMNNISLDEPAEVTYRYDTIRTERPHDGIFTYPSRTVAPESTKRSVDNPYAKEKLPLLAIKTNLVWAATLTPNLSGEIGLGRKTSIEVSVGNNRWNLDGDKNNNKKLVHWLVKPEFRWWLCERFDGHFFGLHGLYTQYNVSGHNIPIVGFKKAYRYEGDAWGVGVSYGYHWAWSKHWGMEFNAGLGVAWMDYVQKDCEKCGNEIGHFKKTYFGPTALGVKILFMIK